MLDKNLIVVSRNWHEPFIRVSITDLDLKVVMTLDDFATAFAYEIGAERTQVAKTFEKVVDKMKSETAKAL